MLSLIKRKGKEWLQIIQRTFNRTIHDLSAKIQRSFIGLLNFLRADIASVSQAKLPMVTNLISWPTQEKITFIQSVYL